MTSTKNDKSKKIPSPLLNLVNNYAKAGTDRLKYDLAKLPPVEVLKKTEK